MADDSWVIDFRGQEDDKLVIEWMDFEPSSSTAKIHRVPTTVKDTEEHYQKYYVPKVVSIGPYHHEKPELDLGEKLKLHFTRKLLVNIENLRSLCTEFEEPSKVQELRNFYEEESTVAFCDKAFVKMMLLDACFILYYIQHIFSENFENCQELKSHQIVFVRQDLLLLENQIPYKVLEDVMRFLNIYRDGDKKIKRFINENSLARGRHRKSLRELVGNSSSSDHLVGCCAGSKVKREWDVIRNRSDHLLHLLHRNLTREDRDPKDDSKHNIRRTFRNVNELKDAGIQFQPGSTRSLADIKFWRTWWWISARVKLPPITVIDSTKPMLLNLIAYEMCSHNAQDSLVTSYICFLDSLIDHPEDVQTLRRAGVLDHSVGSDNEVAKLFNEIGPNLVPNNIAYVDAMNKIQKHYESYYNFNAPISQLKYQYFNSPWSFLALVGASLALFLTAVQTYFTVWSPKG